MIILSLNNLRLLVMELLVLLLPVSSTYNSVQPPAVSHQLPSVENESINVTTANLASSQLYPNAGTSPQTATSSYSGLPQNNSLPKSNIIPNAMNVLLDMNDTDISQELMAYESEGVDSGASSNSPLSFTPSYTTPPNLPMDRSFSLPPRNFQSQMWHGAGRYRNYSIFDCVSVNLQWKGEIPSNVSTPG